MEKSKRRLAKVLGVAGAGAAIWHKPVVNAVSLPAHAAMSGTLYSGEAMTLTEPSAFFRRMPNEEPEGVLDLLFPNAYAGHDLGGTDRLLMCVWVSGNQAYLTIHRIENRCENRGDDQIHYLYEGSGEIGTEIVLTVLKSRVQSTHTPTLLPVSVTLSNLIADVSVDIKVENTGSCEGPCAEYNYTLNLSETCEEVEFTAGSFECEEEP